MTALRSDVATEIGTLTPRVDALAVAGTATGAALRELRGEVVTSVEELRDRLVAASSDSLDALRGAMTDTRSAVADLARVLREDLLHRIDEQYATVAERLAGVAADVAGGTTASRESGERLTALATLTDGGRRTLDALRGTVTSSTDDLRTGLLARADEQLEAMADRFAGVRTTLDERVGALETTVRSRNAALEATVGEQTTAVTQDVAARVAELSEAVDDRTSRLSADVLDRLGALETTVDGGLTGFGGRVDQLSATVGASKDSTREAGERLLALGDTVRTQREERGELLDVVRDDVVEATRDLRKELITRTAEQITALTERLTVLDTTLDETSADVLGRLGELGELGELGTTVSRAATASESTTEGLAGLGEVQGGLAQAVEGFRSEWPTRTFEIVQGAKAVAEVVVRDVRAQVQQQLELVREELAHTAGEVEAARDGLQSGTHRLSRAGKVLVAYLEQRDLLLEAERDRVLLEAERDRVLHEVLDSFASGLSAKERTALAGRVSDAVARRRDARDADRYRFAVGEPSSPVVDLPEDVGRLAPDDGATAAAAREARARRIEAARPADPPSAARGSLATPVAPAKRPAKAVTAVPRSGAAPAKAAPATPTKEKVDAAAKAAPAKNAAPAKKAASAKAGPAKPSTGAAAPRSRGVQRRATGTTSTSVEDPAGQPEASTDTGKDSDRRGRLAAMPEVPSVQVALDAAAPPDEDATPSERSWQTSWGSRPDAPPPAEGELEDEPGVRSSLRRRRQP